MSKSVESDGAGKTTSRRFKTIMAGAGIAIGAMTLTGVGIAAFNFPVGGSAAGKVLDSTSMRRLEFVATTGPNADLLPGGLGAAQFTVKNANTFPVKVSQMTLDFANITVKKATGVTGDCLPANFLPGTAVTGNGNVAVDISVGAEGESAPQVVKNVFKLSPDAPDACQGASFTIPVTSAAVVSG
jgi:hypothetical protein